MAGPPIELDYAPRAAGSATVLRWMRRLNVALAAWPVLLVLSIHAIYGIERVQYGAWPGPWNNALPWSWAGPLYLTSYALLLGGYCAFLFHVFHIVALVRDEIQARHFRRVTVAFAMLLTWPAALVVLRWDPIGAMYYFMD